MMKSIIVTLLLFYVSIIVSFEYVSIDNIPKPVYRKYWWHNTTINPSILPMQAIWDTESTTPAPSYYFEACQYGQISAFSGPVSTSFFTTTNISLPDIYVVRSGYNFISSGSNIKPSVLCVAGSLEINSDTTNMTGYGNLVILPGGILRLFDVPQPQPLSSSTPSLQWARFGSIPLIYNYGTIINEHTGVSSLNSFAASYHNESYISFNVVANPSYQYSMVTNSSGYFNVTYSSFIIENGQTLYPSSQPDAVLSRLIENNNCPALNFLNSIPILNLANGTVQFDNGVIYNINGQTTNAPFSDATISSSGQVTEGTNQRFRSGIISTYGSSVVFNGVLFIDSPTMPETRALLSSHHGTITLNNCVFISNNRGSIINAEYGTEVISSNNCIYYGQSSPRTYSDVPSNLDFGSQGCAITSLSPHVSSVGDTFLGSFPGGAINIVQLSNRSQVTGQFYDLHLSDNKYHDSNTNPYSITSSPLKIQSTFSLSDGLMPSISLGGSSGTSYPSITISGSTFYNPIRILTPGNIILNNCTIETSQAFLTGGKGSINFLNSNILSSGNSTTSLTDNTLQTVSFLNTIISNLNVPIKLVQDSKQLIQPYVVIKKNINNQNQIPNNIIIIPNLESTVLIGQSTQFSIEFTLENFTCKAINIKDSSSLPIEGIVSFNSTTNQSKCLINYLTVVDQLPGPVYLQVNIISTNDNQTLFSIQLPRVYVLPKQLEFKRGWDIGPSTIGNSTKSVNGSLWYSSCTVDSSCIISNSIINLSLPSVSDTGSNSTNEMLSSGVTTNGFAPIQLTLNNMTSGLYQMDVYMIYSFTAPSPRSNEVVDSASGTTFQITVDGQSYTPWISVSSTSPAYYKSTIYFERTINGGDGIIRISSSSGFYVSGLSYSTTFYEPPPPPEQPSSPSSTNNIVIIIPVVIGALVIAALVVGFLLYRRRRNRPGMSRKVDVELVDSQRGGSRNNKLNSSSSSLANNSSGSYSPRSVPSSPSRTALKASGTNFNSEKYRLHPSIYDIIQETQNYVFDNPNLPLTFTSTRLDFGMGGMKCQIDQNLQDSITIVNKSQHPVTFDLLLPPSSAAILLSSDANESITLKPGRNQTINFNARLLCTTKVMERIAIAIADFGHTFIYMAVESVLSTQLDYDELTFFEPPIGEGSFGVVYRGQWRGQDVAIKKLKIGHLMGPNADLINDVYREMDLMNKLRHPNIVSYVGAVKTSDKLCLVSEFIPMGSLAKVLYSERRVLTLREKIRIALDTAKGCNFLHQCGIMHRDLKPDNILVVTLATDAQVCVKLTDFGTSKEVTDFDLSSYTSGIGTPIYMANEILEKQQYDNSADVYSYAIMFYELILGEVPFGEFKNVWEIPRFILSGKRPTRGLENTPQPIVDLINECWLHDPSKRPNFNSIIPRLEQILEDTPN